MNYKLYIKDNKLRQVLIKLELQKKVVNYYMHNKNLIKNPNIFLVKKIYKILNNKKSFNKINNRCIFTYKNKTIKKTRLSRFKLRELILFNNLSGFNKNSW